ncbi:4-(cytidine 5'-diphospho)-2-C-methyl-D-erythritol kinase [Nakamurella sp. YIM 132087]|uniref:4-diphosphocytidyl-2-C-methyl-D-erythritol kinase n=1 Tax=Nakamurella alba TaxID=2665158 RepID=A0A7K1FF18_9ACTN|nr:4-(cytidine 5'-diphospho)-2-C-methyl-D-erythritol kinase [Nakamurella alba]MTD12702.1 4-(cytidine 5'-diphospho)-2-C-methyl-D-erythritol kinase [Nakamurella alba]
MSRSTQEVRVRVPAKINLLLAVGDLRPDGYHDLVTVFHAVDLFDELVVRLADRHSVRTVSPGSKAVAGVPAGARNLAGMAARRLAKEYRATGPVAIEITKQIPVAGGMAGGSADAAGALVACDRLWGTDVPRDRLAAIAAELGSDVPFALRGGTAVGTGRGNLLSPVLTRMQLHWVLGLGHEGLLTPAVFGELDRLRAAGDPPRVPGVEDMLSALASHDVHRVAAALGNDLQAAAISLQPGLRRTLQAGLQAGALGGIVSGSGPTTAFLCESAQAAADVATELAGTGTCRSVRVASGPVPGARVIG